MKETLEEAYLNQLIDEANKEFTLDRKLAKEVAIKFSKWQAERMFSEEEVKKLIKLHSDFIDSKIDYEGINNATTAISNPEWNDEEWFEQFKKN